MESESSVRIWSRDSPVCSAKLLLDLCSLKTQIHPSKIVQATSGDSGPPPPQMFCVMKVEVRDVIHYRDLLGVSGKVSQLSIHPRGGAGSIPVGVSAV